MVILSNELIHRFRGGVRLKKLLMVIFIVLLLTACTKTINNDFTFVGESEHWEAEYSYTGTEVWREDDGRTMYSNEDSYEFTLKYKGSLEELSSMKTLEYSFKTNGKGGSRSQEYTEPNKEVIFISKGSSKGGAKVSQDQVIQVNVKWDDSKESFELQNKSK